MALSDLNFALSDINFANLDLSNTGRPAKPSKPRAKRTRRTQPQYAYPTPDQIPPGWEVYWGGAGIGWIVGVR